MASNSLIQQVVEFLSAFEYEKTQKTFFKYFVIDEALRRNGLEVRHVSKEKLFDLVNRRVSENSSEHAIAERRFHVLLEEMKTLFDAPIAHQKGEGKGYYYEQPGYSLGAAIIQKGKKELLPGTEVLDGMLGFITQFDELLPYIADYENLTAQIRGALAKPANIIQMDINRSVEGLDWIKQCYDAINSQTPLKIIYKPFGKEPQEFLLHPYQLREWRYRWFLWGWNQIREEISILALDRIRSIIATTMVTYNGIHKEESLMKFNTIIGVSFPEGVPLTDIVVRVNEKLANYLKTKPVHPSQQLLGDVDEKGNVKFAYRLIPNYEFEQWILGLGESIRVLQPLALVHRIQLRIQRMASLYSGPSL